MYSRLAVKGDARRYHSTDILRNHAHELCNTVLKSPKVRVTATMTATFLKAGMTISGHGPSEYDDYTYLSAAGWSETLYARLTATKPQPDRNQTATNE